MHIILQRTPPGQEHDSVPRQADALMSTFALSSCIQVETLYQGPANRDKNTQASAVHISTP